MKNKFLLLGATAILSAGALLANAAGVTLSAKIGFIGSFTATEVRELSFGRIVNPQPGQTVVVNAKGEVSGTGTIVSTIDTTNDGAYSNTPVHTGQIKVSRRAVFTDDYDIHVAGTGIGFGEPIELTTPNGLVCGKVKFESDLEYDHADDDYNYYNYGGTFTAEDVQFVEIPDGGPQDYYLGVICTGSGTATLILDENGWWG